MSKIAGTRAFREASLAKTLAMVGDAIKVVIDRCVIDANLSGSPPYPELQLGSGPATREIQRRATRAVRTSGGPAK
jgi:hypothetical protein